MSVRDNGKVMGVLTLVVGAMIGAGIALLFAPGSGERTRREISLTARKAGRRVRRAARGFSDDVSGLVDGLEQGAGKLGEKGKEIAHDAKRGLQDTLEAGEEMLVRQKERLAKIRG
jgi:gas vesicle protein